MEKKKSKIGCLIKVFLIFIIILTIVISGTYILYKMTKEEVKKYIPLDYTGYIKIDSLMDTYNSLVDLRASDVILSKTELKDIYKTILDIRSTKILKNKFLAKLINLKANIIIKKDYSPILLFDLGYKSIITRSSQFMTKFMGNHNKFSLEKLNSKNNIYQLHLKTYNRVLYISVCKNLLFVAFNKEDIDYLYETKQKANNIYYDENFKFIKNKTKNFGMADIYFNTNEVFQPLFLSSYKVNKIINKFKYNTNTAISMNITNEDFLLNTYTSYYTTDKKINDFIWNESGKLDVVDYLPNDTNLYSGIKIKSFEEFYKVFLYLNERQYDEKIKTIDKSSKLLFGLGIEEIIFSWIGTEIGAYTSDISTHPVVFLKIKNKKKLETVLKKVTKSIVLKEESKIIYNDVNLKKISIRNFLQPIIEIFIKGLDTPYYKIIDNYIFFSMDPATLANLEKKYNDKLTITSDKVYKSISSKIKNKANIFLYFNMTEKIPNFLKMNKILPDILKLYEKGILTINFDNTNLEIDIAAAGVNIRKAKNFPGYPQQLEHNITSPILCKNITGSSVEELIYTTKNEKLFITNFNNNPIKNFPVSLNGISNNAPILTNFNNDKNLYIFVFTDKGYLHSFDTKGNEKLSYPIETDFKDSFYPVYFNGSLLFYSNKEKKLFIFKNEKFTEINNEITSPLLSPVTVYNNILAFYPKSFSGTINLINSNGNPVKGWPKEAGGIGFGSPVINRIGNEHIGSVIFMTQKGDLNIWKLDGNKKDGFPLKFSGVYYTQPVVGNVDSKSDREIVTLDKNGNISIISGNGSIILSKEIKEANSKENKILLFDINNDNINEIFIYGGSNNIIALDSKLNILPGFPVKGNTKPSFTDFDSDGQYEMVVAGVDKFIYVYTIPN